VILVTVSSSGSFHSEVKQALDDHFRFEDAWELRYIDTARLRTADQKGKYLVVMDFSDGHRALPMAEVVDGKPHFASIAIGAGGTRDELLELMQAGIRDVSPGFNPADILRTANRAVVKLSGLDDRAGELYAFVPAKPGCGATTVATNATAVAAGMSEEPTLLLDFDIRLGVTSFLLKAEGNHTVIDALQQSHRLDHDIWSNLIAQRGNLHVLGSGPMDFSQTIPPENFSNILDYALRNYSRVSVDLPGTAEVYECETLLRCKRIFLVCTPETSALHVARRKSNWLRDMGLAEKVSMVLNHVDRRNTFSVADIERIIQLKVDYMLPASAQEVSRAVQKGIPIQGSSSLAKQIARLASDISATDSVKRRSGVRRFVDYFSISAAREIPS
jgi:Flp pilus assembly CpaE family ATPase